MSKISSLFKRKKELQEPELHIVGQIVGASNINVGNAFSTIRVVRGKDNWSCVEGTEKGQTQIDYPLEGGMIVWNHPIDLHYYAKSIQGWPKIVFEVYSMDFYGGHQICGYSCCSVPTSPGVHELDCPIWRPCGTHKDEVYDFYVGCTPRLMSHAKALIHDPVVAKEERCRLFTKTVGTIHLQLSIVLRNMKSHKVQS